MLLTKKNKITNTNFIDKFRNTNFTYLLIYLFTNLLIY